MQSVPCAGTVENIITSLFSSVHSTLHSQLSSAMSSLALTTGAPSSSPLSLLPALWSSTTSTQIVLLATQLSLDTAVEAAVQSRGAETSTSGSSLEKLYEEIRGLMQGAVRMLQGRHGHSVAPENTVQQEESVGGILGDGGPTSVPVTREQENRLRNVLFVLSHALQQVVESLQQESGSGGFLWCGQLRWVWSGGAAEEACHLTTLGARLSYGYHYIGSGSGLVLTPPTERALVCLLQAVHQGRHTLLTGPEVHIIVMCTRHICIVDTYHSFHQLWCNTFTSSHVLYSALLSIHTTLYRHTHTCYYTGKWQEQPGS